MCCSKRLIGVFFHVLSVKTLKIKQYFVPIVKVVLHNIIFHIYTYFSLFTKINKSAPKSVLFKIPNYQSSKNQR